MANNTYHAVRVSDVADIEVSTETWDGVGFVRMCTNIGVVGAPVKIDRRTTLELIAALADAADLSLAEIGGYRANDAHERRMNNNAENPR